MSTDTRTYAATDSIGRKCRATTTNGRTFAVLLSVDPGYGSMVFTQVHVSQLNLIAEVDPASFDQA